MEKYQFLEYTYIHHMLSPYLSKENDVDSKKPRLNPTTHRALSTITLDINLYRLERSASQIIRTDAVNEWHDCSLEVTYATYYNHVCRDPFAPSYRDRINAAIYISCLSSKFAYVAYLLAKLIFDSKKRVIVFCDWLLTLWDVKLFLTMLGVQFVNIRFAINAAKRKAPVAKFNNSSETLNALLVFLRTFFTSINLQKVCCRIIILEGFESVNNLL